MHTHTANCEQEITPFTNNQSRLRRGWALVLAIMLAFGLALALPAGLAWAAIQPNAPLATAELDQCLNGTYASPALCVGNSAPPSTGWVNGNADQNYAHWAEGEVVPFRVHLTGLTPGQHRIDIEYTYTANGGLKAYDYLTSYTETMTTANACDGLFGGACPASATFPIPFDTVLNTCPSAQHDPLGGPFEVITGHLTIFGGSITAANYVAPIHPCDGPNIWQTFAVTFTVPAGSGEAVIAWGGHIAAEYDWGNGYTAHILASAPYRMRLLTLDGAANLQERTLRTAAVYSTDIRTTVSPANAIGQPAFDTVHLQGNLGPGISATPVISGWVNFYICVNNTGPAPWGPPFVTGCDHSAGTLVNPTPIPVNGNGDYISPNYYPTRNGFYCFRSEFTPAPGQPYPFARESNTLLPADDPLEAECFILYDPTAVQLTGFQAANAQSAMPLAIFGAILLALSAAMILGRTLARRADIRRVSTDPTLEID
jgi:hypothetical protein